MTGDQLGEFTGFRKFDHVERGKHRAVDDICRGTTHVFPKLDGSNGSVWAEVEQKLSGEKIVVQCGSRNNTLSINKDNAGFHAYIKGDSDVAENIRLFVLANPNLILYGEWLVPHTIKNYVADAWRKFYIFDIFDRNLGLYLDWTHAQAMLANAGISSIIPSVVIENPTGPELDALTEKMSCFLCEEGTVGEGIVVKNYGWRNIFDRQPWMKILADGFRDKAKRPAIGVGEDATEIEIEISNALVDQHLVDKEFAKGVLRLADNMKVTIMDESVVDKMAPVDGVTYVGSESFVAEHRGKVIGILLAQVFNDVIEDRLTARVLKKFGYPTINFRSFRSVITTRVKLLKPELFS